MDRHPGRISLSRMVDWEILLINLRPAELSHSQRIVSEASASFR